MKIIHIWLFVSYFTLYLLIYLKKYPQCYSLCITLTNSYYIENKLTNDKYYIPYLFIHSSTELLNIISVCVPVDFNLLEKVGSNYFIKASNSLYSINWQVSDRLGYDLIKLHGPAPGWQVGENLYNNYVMFLDSVNSKKIRWRSSMFVVNTPVLFLPNHNTRVPLVSEVGTAEGYRVQDTYIRREFQTFHRLPQSGLIVFSVRTFLQSLDTFSLNELYEFRNITSNWSKSQFVYHNRDSWFSILNNHIEVLDKKKWTSFRNL